MPSYIHAPLLLNAREAAETLRISPRKLWELSNSEALASIRVGRRRLYAIDDLRAFVAAQKQAGAR